MSECACTAILVRETSDKNPGTTDQSRWPQGKSKRRSRQGRVRHQREGRDVEIYDMRKTNTHLFHHTLEPHVVWPHLEVCRWQCASNVCSATKGTVRATRSVCTHTVVHTVVATTRVRNPCTTKENLSARPTLWSQRRAKCAATGGAGLDLCHFPPCCTRSWLRACRACETLKVIFYVQIHEGQNLFAHLILSLRTFPGAYSYFRIGGGPSMEQSGLFFCVPSFWSPFIPHPLLLLSLESSLLWVRDPFCTCSRFASVTFLRDFQTLLYQNHGFLMACLTEEHPEFVLLFPWFHTWQQHVLSGL